jgi:hypothetical protein
MPQRAPWGAGDLKPYAKTQQRRTHPHTLSMTLASPLARFARSGLPTQRGPEQANPRASLSQGGAFGVQPNNSRLVEAIRVWFDQGFQKTPA